MEARRFYLPVLAALALAAVPATAGAATCTGVDTPVTSATALEAKAAVLCIVNAERTFRGLPALVSNDKLALAAQRHADDMVARDYFDHYAPAPAPFGVDPGQRIVAAGYAWTTYGENIAYGYTTPRDVMTAWMKSAGHCRNILAPGFAEIGIGLSGPSMWSQDFARHPGIAAPSTNSGPQRGCADDGLPGLDAPDAPPVAAPVAPAPDVPAATPVVPAPHVTHPAHPRRHRLAHRRLRHHGRTARQASWHRHRRP